MTTHWIKGFETALQRCLWLAFISVLLINGYHFMRNYSTEATFDGTASFLEQMTDRSTLTLKAEGTGGGGQILIYINGKQVGTLTGGEEIDLTVRDYDLVQVKGQGEGFPQRITVVEAKNLDPRHIASRLQVESQFQTIAMIRLL